MDIPRLRHQSSVYCLTKTVDLFLLKTNNIGDFVVISLSLILLSQYKVSHTCVSPQGRLVKRSFAGKANTWFLGGDAMSSAKILLLFEKSKFGHNYEVITYSLQVTGSACHH